MTKRKTQASGAKRVALYLRVSTTGQTTTNQRRELEAVAARHGWEVVQIFSDNGVSGDDFG
jgi:DNA invertase Pin-like site-specific DNA recombinase